VHATLGEGMVMKGLQSAVKCVKYAVNDEGKYMSFFFIATFMFIKVAVDHFWKALNHDMTKPAVF